MTKLLDLTDGSLIGSGDVEDLTANQPGIGGPPGAVIVKPAGSRNQDTASQATDAARLVAMLVIADVATPQTAEAAPVKAEEPENPYEITTYYMPSDTLFGNQWHLNNTGQSGGTAGVDLNLLTVWDEFTGNGVTVGIWDDGVQYGHHDLNDNYDTALHITVNGTIHDPNPENVSSAHGTSVAGVIAAENNGSGTVGVAFGATIAGVDIFYDSVHGFNATAAMTSELDNFDVTNHSWGFTGRFAANILNTGTAFWVAFFDGIEASVINGRGGLGTINLVAAGNDRTAGRDSNDSNFTNLPQTISIAAVGHDGFVSWYSTPGAANLVAGPSSGPTGSGIWTTDRTGADGYSNGANEAGNTEADYTNDFGGTSSATPAVSGVVALMLEANPLLGWRDVQDILAMTARHTGSPLTGGIAGSELYNWEINGATNWNAGGMHFSNDYGFGLVDAFAAVRLAESWTQQDTSANWADVVSATWTGSTIIPDNDNAGINFTLTVTDTTELEHVGLTVRFDTASWFGDYLITLISPSGTVSYLSRPLNNGDALNGDFFLMSNAFRGESGVGTWTVNISDRWLAVTGTLEGLELRFFGNAASADDVYVFTNEYLALQAIEASRATVTDSNGGTDELNLAAVTGDVALDMASGQTFSVNGVNWAQLSGDFENAVTGDGNDTITGNDLANTIRGMRGNDTLKGGGGDDALNGGDSDDFLKGGGGADALDGGSGIDTLSYFFDVAVTVDLSTNAVSGSGATGDTIINFENVEGSNSEGDTITGDGNANMLNGNGGNDTINGGDGNDTINGGDGNDTITDTSFDGSTNTVDGGDGDDHLINQYTDVGGSWDGGIGNDTIDFSADTFDDINGGGTMDLGAASFTLFLTVYKNFENLLGSQGNNVITGTSSANTLNGQGGNDTINGGLGDDTLLGGDGNDTLNGQGGNDSLSGGAGDDSYIVGENLDTVTEAVGGGTDTVFTSATFALGAGQEIENLRTTNQAGLAGIGLFGNEFANSITGNAGANTINGGGGADQLRGLGGNDTYTVDNAGDVVTEAVGGGNDQVLASISYSLAGGQEIETLKTNNDAGVSNINLTGNEFANSMTGNAGNNVLNGGLGADTMRGLAGNDSFVVDNAGDVVIENAGQGTDTVFASVSHALQSGQEIENLQTNNASAVTAINLTGNNLNNNIQGNAGNNIINGGGGVDTMVGFGGNDTYVVDNAGDIVNESAGGGTDTVLTSASYTLLAGREIEVLQTNNAGATDALVLTGNQFAQSITGNAGNNTLNGKLGLDTLNGGNGQDSFVFDTALNAGNIDTITSFIVADDTIVLDDAIFAALGLGTLATGAFNTGAAATQADDRIIWNGATKALLYDADGLGGLAAIQFATLTNVGGVLSAGDFSVI